MSMALHATIDPVYFRGNNFFLVIQRITASGTYAALGDPLDFASLSRTSKKQPKAVVIFGNGGFIYSYDLTNKKVRVWTNSAGGVNLGLTEHSAAALVAGVTGDTIEAWILFA